MFNLLKCLFLLIAILTSTFANGSYTQDLGRIQEIFIGADGHMAIHLEGGHPNAVATGQCPGSDGYWIGSNDANNALKALLLAAKATGGTILVTSQGCEGTTWIKLLDAYWK